MHDRSSYPAWKIVSYFLVRNIRTCQDNSCGNRVTRDYLDEEELVCLILPAWRVLREYLSDSQFFLYFER